MKFYIRILLLSFICASCASLYHVQVGEIDNRFPKNMVPFEIKVSEYGVDLEDVKSTSKVLLSSKDSKNTNDALSFLQMFQMGPSTGVPVFSINYANHLEEKIRKQCPSGNVTGVMSIREARNYPIIKGEIVKIKGYCIKSGKEKL
ncbi:MAG: hypothetical protein KDD45_02110 [Bdellovibrionales bacterium]|nr:hypothetical protein [Bdellovibrionales bacterium]